MQNAGDHVIGIDLGTTMSAVSITDDIGNVSTIPNSRGSKLTPSAVLLTPKEILVGQDAVDRALEFPNTFAECFKRNIGQAAYPNKINGFMVPPEVLSAFLIESLKRDAEQYVGQQINNAVITVPAFYGSKRRQATRLAGELAGLNVLDIVNEPTAAALAYGFRHQFFTTPNESKRLLVFDLGGGTFDVSLLQFSKETFETLATDGNVQLGGRDFDAAIKDHVANKFMEIYGVDPRGSVAHLLELFSRSKQAKHDLSKEKKTSISCNFEGMRLNVELSRRDFEELIEANIDLAFYTCESVLQTQQMQWSDLDHILFVGGSCRIPFVGTRMEQRSGIKPAIAEDPDEIVAQGASIFAASKSLDESVGIEIVNVNSHSLGFSGIDVATKEKFNKIVIPRNTPLPAVAKKRFVTHKDGQKWVTVTLLEGESTVPKYCEIVAQSQIVLNPNTPAGTDIEVICQCQEDGTIHVSARLPKDGKATSLEVRRKTVSKFDSLDTWKAKLLNNDSTEIESTSPIPDLPSKNGESYQYQEIGKVAFVATLVPELIPQRRAIQRAIDELIFFRKVAEGLEKKVNLESDRIKKAEWEGKLHRCQNEFANVERFAQHCRIVLGKECIRMDFLPPGTEPLADQVRILSGADQKSL